MSKKISLTFARFAQTVVIVILLSVLIFVKTDSNVKGNNSAVELTLPADPSGNQAVNGQALEGPGFIMVSPYEFKPFNPTKPYKYSINGLYTENATETEFVAPLTLPDHATITRVTMYFWDSSSPTLWLSLARGNSQNSYSTMASLYSDGGEVGYRSNATTPGEVNFVVENQNFSYNLRVFFPASVFQTIVLTNVRIDYAYTVSAPLVLK